MGKIGVVILTIITCLFGEVHSSFANEYYVSKIGKDASTCITSPGPDSSSCRTIMYVVNNATLVGGDTVYLQAGTYDENLILTSADSGSSGNYVTFKSYQNDDVIITTTSTAPYATIEIYDAKGWTQYIKFDGSGTDSGKHLRVTTTASERCFMIRYARYIWLTNLEIDSASPNEGIKFCSKNAGTDSGGVQDDTGSRNCIVEYCNIHDNADYGIKITGWGTATNTIRYCNIYSNGKAAGTARYGINLSGSGYASYPPNGNIIHHCNIYSNYSHGINVLYATGTQLYNNKFYSNGTTDTAGVGIGLSTKASGSSVYNNEVYSNAYYGIANGASGANSNKYYNNVIYSNCTGPNQCYDLIQQNGGDSNLYYNNTVYSTVSGFNTAVYFKTGTNTAIKNNIFYRNGSGITFRADVNTLVVYNNDIYSTAGANQACQLDGSNRNVTYLNDTWSGDASGNIFEVPAWDAYYQLTSSSPQGAGHVRDGGLNLSVTFTTDKNGTPRPQGAGWDMGAHEFIKDSTLASPKNLRITGN